MFNHVQPLCPMNTLPGTADIWDDIIDPPPWEEWLEDPISRSVFLCLVRVLDALQGK
jgi:hypothetical protein